MHQREAKQSVFDVVEHAVGGVALARLDARGQRRDQRAGEQGEHGEDDGQFDEGEATKFRLAWG